MANLLSLRQQVRAKTLVEAGQFSDADLSIIINNGIQDVASKFRWPFLAAMSDVAYVASTAQYALPADLARVAAVVEQDTTAPLIPIAPHDSWRQYGGTTPTGTPKSFYLWGNDIYIVPAPTTSSGGFRIFYYRTPTLLTDDTHEPEWEAIFHKVLVDYGCAHVWEREEDFEKSKVYMDRYDQGVEVMARHYLQRADNAPWALGESSDRIRYWHPFRHLWV